MNKPRPIGTRDGRTHSFLLIYRAAIDAIMQGIPAAKRAHVVATYTALAYHTRESRSLVETRRIAETAGLSEASIKRALKLLVTHKLVHKRARFGKISGKQVCLANEYTLLDVPPSDREKPTPYPPRKADRNPGGNPGKS